MKAKGKVVNSKLARKARKLMGKLIAAYERAVKEDPYKEWAIVQAVLDEAERLGLSWDEEYQAIPGSKSEGFDPYTIVGYNFRTRKGDYIGHMEHKLVEDKEVIFDIRVVSAY